MADPSVFTGRDPTDVDQLRALQAEKVYEMSLDPRNFANQGLGGAAAMIMAGRGGSAAQSALGDVVARRALAYPDQATALAAPNPLSYVAEHPDLDVLARADIINSISPLAQAQQAQTAAEAAKIAVDTERLRRTLPPDFGPGGVRSPYTPPGASGGAPVAAPRAGGASGAPGTIGGTGPKFMTQGGGRYKPNTGTAPGGVPNFKTLAEATAYSRTLTIPGGQICICAVAG